MDRQYNLNVVKHFEIQYSCLRPVAELHTLDTDTGDDRGPGGWHLARRNHSLGQYCSTSYKTSPSMTLIKSIEKTMNVLNMH